MVQCMFLVRNLLVLHATWLASGQNVQNLPNGSRPFMTKPLPSGLIDLDVLMTTPFTGGWRGGHIFQIGSLMAVDVINSQQLILPGYRLKLHWNDDKCNTDYATKTVLQKWAENPNWVALAGTGCSGVCGGVANINHVIRMPFVAFGCTSASLGDTVKYPAFVRMFPSENIIMRSYGYFAKEFGWKKINVISGTPKRFDPYVAALKTYNAEELNITLEFHPRDPSFEELVQIWTNMKVKLERVVIIPGYVGFIQLNVCASLAAGVPKGVIWFGVQETPMLDMTDTHAACTKQMMVEQFSGAISSKGTYRPPKEEEGRQMDCMKGWTSGGMIELITNHSKIGYPIGENIVPSTSLTGMRGNYGADGICAVAYMLRHMILTRGFAPSQLKRPTQAIFDETVGYLRGDLNFIGVSGKVDFYKNGLPGMVGVFQCQGEVCGGKGWPVVGYMNQEFAVTETDGHTISWMGDTRPTDSFPACPTGQLLDRDWQCQSCAKGRYFEPLLKDCVDCEPGFVNDVVGAPAGRQACKACPLGTFAGKAGQSTCSQCAPGTFAALPGTSTCSKCMKGSFAKQAGMDKCDACPIGSFQDTGGMSQCKSCGNGRKSPELFTTFERVISSSGVRRWMMIAGAEDASKCGCTVGARMVGKGECVSCAQGFNCDWDSSDDLGGGPNDSRTLQEIQAVERSKAGYMLHPDFEGAFKCGSAIVCPGGDVETPCASGASGIACADCGKGGRYNWLEGECESCSTSGLGWLRVLLAILVCVVLTTGVYFTADTIPVTDYLDIGTHLGMECGLILTGFQISNVLRSIQIASGPTGDVFASMNVFNLDLSLFKVDCDLQNPVDFFSFTSLMPLLLMFVLLCLSVTRRLDKEQTLQIIGQLFQAFFITIVAHAAMPLDTVDHPNGEKGVAMFPTVLHGTSEYGGIVSLVAVQFVIYGFGYVSINVFACWTLSKMRAQPDLSQAKEHANSVWRQTLFGMAPKDKAFEQKELNWGFQEAGAKKSFRESVKSTLSNEEGKKQQDETKSRTSRFLMQYRYLFHRFKPDVFWWGLVIMLRNLCIAFVPAVSGKHLKLLMLEVVLAGALFLQCSFWPWRYKWHNICEAVVLLVFLFVSITCGFDLPDEEWATDPASEGVSWTVTMMLGFLYLAIICVPLYLMRQALWFKMEQIHKRLSLTRHSLTDQQTTGTPAQEPTAPPQ